MIVLKHRFKIVRKRVPTRRRMAFRQLWPSGWMDHDAAW